MAKKQLTVNMIYGGSFHRIDSILDEEKIPPNLRKPEYLKEPDRKKKAQEYEEILTDELFEETEFVDEEEEQEPEEEPPQPPPRLIRKKK